MAQTVAQLTQCIKACKRGDKLCLTACEKAFVLDGGKVFTDPQGGKVFTDPQGGKVSMTPGGVIS
jgi:hypothetical protein